MTPICRVQARSFTASSAPGGVKIGYLFAGLAAAGLSATSYGLYLYYNSFQTWPVEVRGPLRSALRTKAQKDPASSEKFFRVALEKAEGLGEALGSNHLLKITGIYISLAGLYESEGRVEEALETYETAFQYIQSRKPADGPDRMRAIALAQKIGGVAAEIGSPEKLQRAEEQLGWAVAELLKISNAESERQKIASLSTASSSDLQLPDWVSKVQLGATLENLGLFYLSQRRPEYAAPLFSQAMNILLPRKRPGVPTPTFEDRCHAGTVANNLSSTFALNPNKENLETAERWANNAIHISRHTLGDAATAHKEDEAIECGPCLAVGLFNAGLIKEMQGDKEAAFKLITESFQEARSRKFIEGSRQALAALDRLKS